MTKFQKGQGIVEFAFMLPLLLIIIFGLMYIGFIFSDYIALNNIARSAARDASILSAATYKESGYDTVKAKFVPSDANTNVVSLPNSVYLWDPTNDDQFKIEYKKDTQGVEVTLTAPINQDESGMYGVFSSILGNSVANQLVVTYYMYSEQEQEESSSSGS